jgi:DNA-binding PadR family transcriptional regulator
VTLRFALLASLSAGPPRTGYDLVRIFDRSIGNVWHAPHTQIYPELRRMEAEGLVDSAEVPRGPSATKREYRITERGLTVLHDLASTPVEPSPEKDSYRLKAAYLEFADPEGAREQMRLHIAHYERWLENWEAMKGQLEDGSDPTVATRLASHPPEQHERILAFKVFAYEGLIARAHMEIEWARSGLSLMERLGG